MTKARAKEQAELEEKEIHVGDTVRTAHRGGVREGPVKEITDEPKVVFTRKRKGQADKEVRHNPSTLEKVEPGSSAEESLEVAKARSGVRRGFQKRATRRSGRGEQEVEEEEVEEEEEKEEEEEGQAAGPSVKQPATPKKAAAGKGRGKAEKAGPAKKASPAKPPASTPAGKHGGGGGTRKAAGVPAAGGQAGRRTRGSKPATTTRTSKRAKTA